MGRPHTPTKILKLRGSRHAKRPMEPQPQAEATIPEPPAWLSAQAAQHWPGLCQKLIPLRILTVADHEVMAMLCHTLEEYIELSNAVATEGRTTTRGDGHVMAHPNMKLLQSAREQLLRLAREFGLSPASRSALRIGESKGGKEQDIDQLFRLA